MPIRPRPTSLRPAALAAAILLTTTAIGAAAARQDEWFRHQHYRELALRTQQQTWRTLAYLGGDGVTDCSAAPYVTYRRDTRYATLSDHWYVALQLRADAA